MTSTPPLMALALYLNVPPPSIFSKNSQYRKSHCRDKTILWPSLTPWWDFSWQDDIFILNQPLGCSLTCSSSLHSASLASSSSRARCQSCVSLWMSLVSDWLALVAWSSCSRSIEFTWARLALLENTFDSVKPEQTYAWYCETSTNIFNTMKVSWWLKSMTTW